MKERHKCNCCGFYTLVGTIEDIAWDICPVCFWENDIFSENPSDDMSSGANHMTLGEGRENYRKYSACSPREVSFVRLPLTKELHTNNGEKM